MSKLCPGYRLQIKYSCVLGFLLYQTCCFCWCCGCTRLIKDSAVLFLLKRTQAAEDYVAYTAPQAFLAAGVPGRAACHWAKLQSILQPTVTLSLQAGACVLANKWLGDKVDMGKFAGERDTIVTESVVGSGLKISKPAVTT